MFKKKEKPIKEKKVRTMKVGTHKKSVIALLLNAKLNKKKNKENSQNKRKSLIKVNE